MELLRISDIVSLAWRVPLLVIHLTARFTSLCLSRGEASTLNWRQKLALAYLHAFEARLTSNQQAFHLRKPLTGPRIQSYCRKHRLEHKAISLDNATLGDKHSIPAPVLHFVAVPNSQPNGPTIFYFHGGGYHNPIRAEAHIPFLLRCAAASRAKQIIFLEYALSPEHQFPSQLIQAVASLRFLLEEEGIEAKDLIIGGDSAGGNLTTSLLAHIIHPSPHAPPLDLHGGQFKAVLLVSPWVAMSAMEEGDVRAEARHDHLTLDRATHFADLYEPVLDDVWCNPFEAEGSRAVWKRLFPGGGERAVSRRAILAVGTGEVIFDSCVGFGRDFLGGETVRVDGQADLDRIKECDFVLAIAPGDTHVQPAIDVVVRYHDGRMMKAILAFLENC
ncbi:lipase/thioesterase [Aspergillus campestris IBT 28561]|uniref:Lipase/thioesterase n=1 Tax=Aspergillus campestris (strain IBT 28561) TaxID=1392248 RepID=A0A2I1D2I2_ASPC2|nr:lipase/thioesterase [Aspergillus campestris IBT 28561]PKY04086.1 lipase/thioesterase [Aspergillus campestris IBT 28561]